jgi:hypothetical protein
MGIYHTRKDPYFLPYKIREWTWTLAARQTLQALEMIHDCLQQCLKTRQPPPVGSEWAFGAFSALRLDLGRGCRA